MRHGHYTDVEAQLPSEDGCLDVTVRWLIDKKIGAENFAMRMFELGPGGNTPYHQHDWEHEVFLLDGQGTVVGEEGDQDFKPGEFVFIPAMEWHQFKNSGEKAMRFLCLVPYKDWAAGN